MDYSYEDLLNERAHAEAMINSLNEEIGEAVGRIDDIDEEILVLTEELLYEKTSLEYTISSLKNDLERYETIIDEADVMLAQHEGLL